MSNLSKAIVVVLTVVAFAYVGVGYVLAHSSDDKAYQALTVYSEVMDRIQRDYVDEPNIPKVTSGALHGLLDSLDAESSYMSPLEYKDYKQRILVKDKATAGMALTKIRAGYISVLSVLPGSPADKLGLQYADVLEKIGDFNTEQMSIEQARLLLSGDAGAVVKLSVITRAKPEPQEMNITLARTAPPKVTEAKLQDNVGYLGVPEFDESTTKEIHDDLVQMSHEGEQKLILDLRNCSLGEDAEGIATAQLFVLSGTITTLKGQTVSPVVSSADPSKVVWNGPVTVLIGNATAGPAEIVAAAISGNKRGQTVGDRTFGKASMQKLIPMDDGSALILTVANYYTPSGKEIPAEGVAASVPIAPATDQMTGAPLPPPGQTSSGDDPTVKKALQVLQQGTAPAQKAA
ncbi:MAG: S41 family peptidase [Candidatus Acidiferrales bacterium]